VSVESRTQEDIVGSNDQNSPDIVCNCCGSSSHVNDSILKQRSING
jgi:transposase-like protein